MIKAAILAASLALSGKAVLGSGNEPTCAQERPSRITFSLRTEAEGPVKYLHVREGVDLMEQLRWYELARAKEGQPLTEEGKAELIRTLSLEMLSALGKTEPLSGTTLPRSTRFSPEHIRSRVENNTFMSLCEPMHLHSLEPEFLAKLQSEVNQIMEENEAADVASGNHPINWVLSYGKSRSYSLFNSKGDVADNSDLLTFDTSKKRFHGADKYPAVAEFMALFPDTTNWRINVLHPSPPMKPGEGFVSSGFSPHRAYTMHEVHDKKASVEKTAMRMKFHMPVFTQADYVDMHQFDRSYAFEEGNAYYFTNGCPHSVENRGTIPRVHLIWDMLLTEDTFERIFSHGSDLSRNVKRIKGADRQVPIKGAWHWNAFEQEPEKTWTSMEVHFQDLVDVTPPEPCRVPPFEGVNTLRMEDGRWMQAELKNTTIGDEKCDSDAVLVSRWNQATAAGISS